MNDFSDTSKLTLQNINVSDVFVMPILETYPPDAQNGDLAFIKQSDGSLKLQIFYNAEWLE